MIILVLALALALGLSACSETLSAPGADQQTGESSETEQMGESSTPAAERAGTFELFGESFTSDAESLKMAREAAWSGCCSGKRREEALDELSREALTFGEATMRIKVFIMGEEPEDGYPLYIAMHGGGASNTPDVNNGQWEHMFDYYREYVENGIYVAVRGVRDTWDTHFN